MKADRCESRDFVNETLLGGLSESKENRKRRVHSYLLKQTRKNIVEIIEPS